MDIHTWYCHALQSDFFSAPDIIHWRGTSHFGFVTKRDHFSLRVGSEIYATLHTGFFTHFKYKIMPTNFRLRILSQNTVHCYFAQMKESEMGRAFSMHEGDENANNILLVKSELQHHLRGRRIVELIILKMSSWNTVWRYGLDSAGSEWRPL
jgi:hypothetical protein